MFILLKLRKDNLIVLWKAFEIVLICLHPSLLNGFSRSNWSIFWKHVFRFLPNSFWFWCFNSSHSKLYTDIIISPKRNSKLTECSSKSTLNSIINQILSFLKTFSSFFFRTLKLVHMSWLFFGNLGNFDPSTRCFFFYELLPIHFLLRFPEENVLFRIVWKQELSSYWLSINLQFFHSI